MPELIVCPECGRQLNVPDALMGQAVQCPACKVTFTAAPTVMPAQHLRTEAPPSSPFAFNDRRGTSSATAGKEALDFTDTPPKPHRGVFVLVLGLIGCLASCSFLPGLILGYLAWSNASTDLSRMQRGQMDRDGKSLTQAGHFLGMVAMGLACLSPFVNCCCFVMLRSK